jgi:hypothetical protein
MKRLAFAITWCAWLGCSGSGPPGPSNAETPQVDSGDPTSDGGMTGDASGTVEGGPSGDGGAGNDGATTGGDAAIDSGLPFADFSGSWDAIGATGSLASSNVTCKKTSFEIVETAAAITIKARSFDCTYVSNKLPASVDYPERTFSIQNGSLYLDGDGGSVSVGTIDATTMDMTFCVSSLCTHLTLSLLNANRVSYHEDSGTSSAITGTLYRTGSYTPASLLFTDGAKADFGTLDLHTKTTKTLTVKNDGTEPATAISALGLSSPINFLGGSYPGTGGTCATSLTGGQTCTVVVEADIAAASQTATVSKTLQLAYHTIDDDLSSSIEIDASVPYIQTASITPQLVFFNGSYSTDVPYYGYSVSIDGSLALVGAPRFGGEDTGTVYAFQLQGNDWKKVQQFATGGFADYAGNTVVVNGTEALIDEAFGSGTRSFTWNGSQWAVAQPIGGNFSGCSASNRKFAARGNVAAAASAFCNKTVVLYGKTGGTWAIEQTVTGVVTVDAVAAAGEWVAIFQSDGVHLYRRSGTTWTDTQTLAGVSGTSLALDGNTLVVGVANTSMKFFTFDGMTWNAGQTVSGSVGPVAVHGTAAAYTGASTSNSITGGPAGYTTEVSDTWAPLTAVNASGYSVSVTPGWVMVGQPSANKVYFVPY